MKTVLLVQLPIPQFNFGKQTGNVPLGAACLKQAAESAGDHEVDILPESVVSYLGDAAVIDSIRARRADIVGFTVYSWNVDRTLYVAKKIKETAGVRVIFGGPEVTPDNGRVASEGVDFLCFGEGETVFCELLKNPALWARGRAQGSAGAWFTSSPSPFVKGLLEPSIGNVMLLETQRGCPHRCGYCFYNKSRQSLSLADESLLLDGIRWAVEHRIKELYLLDPCLNSRPRLRSLLRKIQTVNTEKRIGIISEIRAEAVDQALAGLFAEAGFIWFEVGLQSTNPKALQIMKRPTDLDRFVQGARLLKENDILPRIDLITGLPGDDLKSFRQTVDFVVENGLQDDVQVFPLSVLPGTDFRRKSRELGLQYEAYPPYPVNRTRTFSPEDLLLAIDYAETRFDVALYPFPTLSIAWRTDDRKPGADGFVRLGGQAYLARLYLNALRPLSEVDALAKKLTHPYQIFIDPNFTDTAYLCQLLTLLTAANPFVPLELVFLEPGRLPDRNLILSAVRLKRPHYLDMDQRFLFPHPGNRAVVFTLVSEDPKPRFTGEMARQAYWWKRSVLPTRSELERMADLDGILIDIPLSEGDLFDWQDRLLPAAEELPHVSFSDLRHQRRWLLMTAENEFSEASLQSIG